jgi:CheY-like chemotaxis protein
MLERIVLVDAGFDVDALADGEEALAHARETPYDLVVTGIELRGVNGLELVAALRAQPHFADVPVIITSSAENPEHRQRARALGVRHYVPKGSLSEQRLGEAARAAFARLEG